MATLQACDSWIVPDWPAPNTVRALCTTRIGGVSRPPFDGLNLAQHVDDQPASVAVNRRWLINAAGLPEEPRWLDQAHGTQVIVAETITSPVTADGSFTRDAGRVCCVLIADCLPVLLCEQSGAAVAAVHAGWRGLAAGIVEAAVKVLAAQTANRLMAWLGPAIGPTAFIVGDEVRAIFVARDAAAVEAFKPAINNGWHADLYCLARQRLIACGVSEIYGGGFCTFTDNQRFYSYRRDKTTGRMATLIWIQT